MNTINTAFKLSNSFNSHKQPKTQNGGGTNDGGYIWVG